MRGGLSAAEVGVKRETGCTGNARVSPQHILIGSQLLTRRNPRAFGSNLPPRCQRVASCSTNAFVAASHNYAIFFILHVRNRLLDNPKFHIIYVRLYSARTKTNKSHLNSDRSSCKSLS